MKVTCDDCKNKQGCADDCNVSLKEFLDKSHNIDWMEIDCADWEMEHERVR